MTGALLVRNKDKNLIEVLTFQVFTRELMARIFPSLIMKGLRRGALIRVCLIRASRAGWFLPSLLQYFTIPPFHHSSFPPFQSSIAPFLQSSIAPIFHHSIPPIFHHSSLPSFHSSNLPSLPLFNINISINDKIYLFINKTLFILAVNLKSRSWKRMKNLKLR